jgi:hypothetical protein
MRAKVITFVAAAAVVAFANPALAQQLAEVLPLGTASAPTVSASEPLAALAVGLGLLGARLLRRRR